jgi:hypothetical protein
MSYGDHQDNIKAGLSESASNVGFAKVWQNRKKEEVKLEAAKPTFFWNHAESRGWIADPLSHPIVSESRIAFDYPTQHWPQPRHAHLVDMRLGSDGRYHWKTPNKHYHGVRTETATHVVLRGEWLSLGESGNFVAVFPKHSTE